VAKLETLLGKPVIATRLAPRFWRRIDQAEIHAPDEIAGKKVTAFAGLARPESFFSTVQGLKGDLVMKLPMPDHCSYTKRHLDHVSTNFIRSRSEWLVTTAKDALKLPPLMRFLPLFYLETDNEVVVGSERLDRMLEDIIKRIE